MGDSIKIKKKDLFAILNGDEQKIEEYMELFKERPCLVCGKQVDIEKHIDAKYCSDKCVQIAFRERNPGRIEQIKHEWYLKRKKRLEREEETT